MNTFNTYFYHFSYQEELNNSHIFQKIVQLTPYIIHIHQLSDFRILFANSKLHETLGYTPTDINEKNLTIFFEKSDSFFADSLATLSDDELKEYENTVVHKNGEERIFITRLNPFRRDKAGNITEILCLSEDITLERKNLENLRHREMIMSEAENLLKFGSWEWDIINDELYWSDGICEIFGYPNRVGLPEKLNSAFYTSHLIDNFKVNDYLSNRLEEKRNFEVERKIRANDGKEKIIFQKAVLIQDKHGNFTKIIGSSADVTESRLFTEKLIENEALMAEGEYILNYGSWSLNAETNEVKWSENMWRIFEYDPLENKDRLLPVDFYLKHIYEEDLQRVRELNEKFLQKGIIPENYEHRVITAKGNIKIFDGKAQILEYKNDKPYKIVGSTIDVTHIKNIQKDLETKINELNRSNTELEQFAYMASHDLQEPLRKIQAFGERVRSKYEDVVGEDGKMYLERMTDATIRMKNLIDSLLSFSRISREKDNFEKTDLNLILKNVCSDLEVKIEEKNAVIHINDLPEIDAIPSQISRLFMNLLSNSLKFSKAVPSLEVSIASLPVSFEEKQYWELSNSIDYVKIFVRDNGIGFEPEFSEKIFMLFQRLHGRSQYEGTGIGLAICRKITDNHHGKIFAESIAGEGAAFIIILPVMQGVV